MNHNTFLFHDSMPSSGSRLARVSFHSLLPSLLNFWVSGQKVKVFHIELSTSYGSAPARLKRYEKRHLMMSRMIMSAVDCQKWRTPCEEFQYQIRVVWYYNLISCSETFSAFLKKWNTRTFQFIESSFGFGKRHTCWEIRGEALTSKLKVDLTSYNGENMRGDIMFKNMERSRLG